MNAEEASQIVMHVAVEVSTGYVAPWKVVLGLMSLAHAVEH